MELSLLVWHWELLLRCLLQLVPVHQSAQPLTASAKAKWHLQLCVIAHWNWEYNAVMSYTASLWQLMGCCAFGSILKCVFVGHLVSLRVSHRGEGGWGHWGAGGRRGSGKVPASVLQLSSKLAKSCPLNWTGGILYIRKQRWWRGWIIFNVPESSVFKCNAKSAARSRLQGVSKATGNVGIHPAASSAWAWGRWTKPKDGYTL